MTDYKTLVKAYRAYLIAFTAVAVAALLIYWLCRGYGGRPEVGAKLDEIKTTAQANERRIEVILDAAKAKESEVKADVSEKVSTVNSDDLPDLLAGLLEEYRRERWR